MLFGLLLVCAIPLFGLGVSAGWFQWRFLAGHSIRKLEIQNAQLRAELQGGSAVEEAPNTNG